MAFELARLFRQGHEYFLKYLLGTQNAVLSDENDEECIKPSEITVRPAAEGKLDLFDRTGFPHVNYLLVRRHRIADCHLVRKRRPQHLGYAPIYPSA